MASQHETVSQISRRTVDNQIHGRHDSPTDIGRFLEGIDYPQSKSDIVAYAYAHGCGDDVIHALETLHERIYETLTEVEVDLGKVSCEPARS